LAAEARSEKVAKKLFDKFGLFEVQTSTNNFGGDMKPIKHETDSDCAFD